MIFMQVSWKTGMLLVCGMFIAFALNLIFRQESLLYVPCVRAGMQTPEDNPEGYRTPGEHGLDYEDVHLEAADGMKLHAWFMKAGKADAPTVLFCHANAGNIGLRVPNYVGVVERLGANILALDYRGYGRSEGTP